MQLYFDVSKFVHMQESIRPQINQFTCNSVLSNQSSLFHNLSSRPSISANGSWRRRAAFFMFFNIGSYLTKFNSILIHIVSFHNGGMDALHCVSGCALRLWFPSLLLFKMIPLMHIQVLFRPNLNSSKHKFVWTNLLFSTCRQLFDDILTHLITNWS